MHSQKIYFIFSTLDVSHFEISGKDVKEVQQSNKLSIIFTFFVFHFDILGKDIKDLQAQNKSFIFSIRNIPLRYI